MPAQFTLICTLSLVIPAHNLVFFPHDTVLASYISDLSVLMYYTVAAAALRIQLQWDPHEQVAAHSYKTRIMAIYKKRIQSCEKIGRTGRFYLFYFPRVAKLKQQIAALQQDSEEERQAWRREVMKLRDQLQQAYQQRDDARTEVQKLCETGEAATAAKVTIDLFLFYWLR